MFLSLLITILTVLFGEKQVRGQKREQAFYAAVVPYVLLHYGPWYVVLWPVLDATTQVEDIKHSGNGKWEECNPSILHV
jgi:hypothetical protein